MRLRYQFATWLTVIAGPFGVADRQAAEPLHSGAQLRSDR